jgi:hypothetical protein
VKRYLLDAGIMSDFINHRKGLDVKVRTRITINLRTPGMTTGAPARYCRRCLGYLPADCEKPRPQRSDRLHANERSCGWIAVAAVVKWKGVCQIPLRVPDRADEPRNHSGNPGRRKVRRYSGVRGRSPQPIAAGLARRRGTPAGSARAPLPEPAGGVQEVVSIPSPGAKCWQ